MMNKEIADFIARAVLTVAEQYEKRTGKPALKFRIELPGEPPAPKRLPAENEITLDLSAYSVDVEVIPTSTEST
jgi:hypothetical protein